MCWNENICSSPHRKAVGKVIDFRIEMYHRFGIFNRLPTRNSNAAPTQIMRSKPNSIVLSFKIDVLVAFVSMRFGFALIQLDVQPRVVDALAARLRGVQQLPHLNSVCGNDDI